jgi:hypothetical protein
MRWAGHVACIGRKRIHKGLWCRNLKGKTPERRRLICEINVKMNLFINWTEGRGVDSSGRK